MNRMRRKKREEVIVEKGSQKGTRRKEGREGVRESGEESSEEESNYLQYVSSFSTRTT